MISEQAPFAHFDYDARRIVHGSFRRADQANSRIIAPEHMLSALFALRDGIVAQTVTNVAGSRAQARTAIVLTVHSGQRPAQVHIDMNPACQAAIAAAARQALMLGDDQISPEHLLLGLLQNADNVALSNLGLTYDAALAEIRRLRQ